VSDEAPAASHSVGASHLSLVTLELRGQSRNSLLQLAALRSRERLQQATRILPSALSVDFEPESFHDRVPKGNISCEGLTKFILV
jgi:hypothetical protein